MDPLFKHKLVLVTGKGGVGKSTVSLALAREAAHAGKRALHVSTRPQPFVSRLFNREKIIGFEPEPMEKNLWALTLDWKECMHEYVLRQIRFELLYHYVFENRVMNYFLEATPGLEDLLYLGKVIDMLGTSGKKAFEYVVVDLPASGHGLNMLRVPQIVASMIPTGPLNRHADRMRQVLINTNLTAICLVTLAEELAVNETIEMVGNLENSLSLIPRAIIVNGVYPKVFEPEELENLKILNLPLLRKMTRSAAVQSRRADEQQAQKERLEEFLRKKSLNVSLPILPFIFDRDFSLASLDHVGRKLRGEGPH